MVWFRGQWSAIALIVAATPLLLMACESVVVPKDDPVDAVNAPGDRAWEWVQERGFSYRFMPLDPYDPEHREEIRARFEHALAHAASMEAEDNIRLTLRRLKEEEGWESPPAVSSGDQSSASLDVAHSTSTPRSVTYMNLSPEGGVYYLSGTTSVQTEGVSAVITHDLYWTVGGTSRRVKGHTSGNARRIFTTWVDITCPQIMSVAAHTDSWRVYSTGTNDWGQGFLGSRTCQPLQPTGCADPNSPYLTHPGHQTYDPYEGGGGCGSGSGGGDDPGDGSSGHSSSCTTEYVEVEVWDGERWVTWWAGEATVCE